MMNRTGVMCSLLLVVLFVIQETDALPRLSRKQRQAPSKDIDSKTLDLVEKQLLTLFGLKKRVVPREHLHVPDFMHQVYQKWNGEIHDDTDEMTNTIRAIHHVDNDFLHGKKSMVFNMKQFPKAESIRKAELHIFRESKKDAFRQAQAALHVHGRNARTRRSLIETRVIDATSSGWEKFNVTSIVEHWIRNPSMEHKFSLDVTASDDKPEPLTDLLHLNRLSSDMSRMEWERKRPILIIQSNEGNKKRERRAVRTPAKHRSSNRHSSKHRARKLHEKAKLEMCRRRKFYLDFRRIGWSQQIISPMGFDMYYCKGTCPKPLGPHMNTTNHAVIQNQVNSFDPTLVPPPCCIPSSLGDQSFLYIDMDSQIVMKTYSDIVVDGCGCR